MAGRSTLNVSLTRELERFVEERVASGLYQTASEVVRDALRLLEEREAARRTALEELRRHVAVGIEQADRGEFLDGDEVFEELKRLSAQRRREAK
jgi:antitoxin ParD1/3/4